MSSITQLDDLRSSQEGTVKDQAEEELLSGNKKPFNYEGFPWFGVLWRFGCSVLFSLLVLDVLYVFSGWDHLKTWDRRLFNAITIMLSSLVSLSVGSLLSLLGATLRWPILASRPHTPREVDMILGMSCPSLAAKIIWHHCWRQKKLSRTTLIISIYLLVNIFGRLSVAIFGLTYNLNDTVLTEYPVMVNDFGFKDWIGTHWLGITVDLQKMKNIAVIGLRDVDTFLHPNHPETFNRKNISGHGLDRSVDGRTVTYTYGAREYRGSEAYSSSERIFRSSSTCIARNYWNGTVWEDGKLVGKLPDDPSEVPPPDDPKHIHIMDGLIKAGLLNLAAQLRTCLTDGNGRPGMPQNVFFNYPAENSTYASRVLLSFPAQDDRLYDYGQGSFNAKLYKDQAFYNFTLDLADDCYAPSFISDMTDDWYANLDFNGYEVSAANIMARVPILTLIGAEKILPRVTLLKGATEQHTVVSTLDVKWGRAATTLAALTAGQAIAVVIAWFASRGILLRDHDSFLSIGRIFRTAMTKIEGTPEGGSLASGRQLADAIQKSAYPPGKIRYGTRKKMDWYELDLWDDVDYFFPDPGQAKYK
ncbi:uncharacterized protein CTHT_0030460 [Thermochaetoides thermophila DSM 1495]|uniref:Uncharacterized protein n=1 Tax=Chaetomium thermophilum (strain DSM 1495 / CBS 144.50 / IMI 039719) TaxID=759272 RepID=G0S3S4_CHATD|nr:hypothetical protein CTHT_0030460 [Thermochaetoides thermophila DSM 1495]EGS21200.1 hypothetical protein CTHT_0030460 [Thermochaetoides thermophila DSM 1495]